jgi:hypothetical protein
MVRISEIVSAACPRVFSVGLKLVELFVEIRAGELVAERIEDVVRGFATTAQPAQLTTNHRTVQQRRHDSSDGGEGSRIVDRDVTRPVDDAGTEPDGRTVPLPDTPHAHLSRKLPASVLD